MTATETTLAEVLADLLKAMKTMNHALLKADSEAVSSAVDSQVGVIQKLETFAPTAWEDLKKEPELRDLVRQIVMMNDHNAELCSHGMRSLQALFSRVRQAQGYGPDGYVPTPAAADTRLSTSV